MANPLAYKWRQRGTFQCWTFAHDPQWNITADEAGCDSMLVLLEFMESGKWSAKKTLELTRPESVANPGRSGQKMKCPDRLVLKLRARGTVPDDHWLIERAGDSLKIEFGVAWIPRLLDAFLAIKAGEGDYSIGTDSHPLWIWWFLA